MGKFFNYDNDIIRGLNKVIDCLWLSILWICFTLPVITIGVSTTSLYHTVHKVIIGDEGYVWQEFTKAFRQNFKQGMIASFIILPILALSIFDFYLLISLASTVNVMKLLFTASIVFFGLFVVWSHVLMAYLARFSNSMKTALKTTVIAVLLNMHWNLLIILLCVCALVLLYYIPGLIIVVPAVYMIIIHNIIERVFSKYM